MALKNQPDDSCSEGQESPQTGEKVALAEGGQLLPAPASPDSASDHLLPVPFLQLFPWPEGTDVFFLSLFLTANPKYHLNYGKSQ